MSRSSDQKLVGRVRSLRLTSFSAEPGQTAGPVIEFAIPVGPSTCPRLHRQVGVWCGAVKSVTVAAATLDWEQPTTVEAHITGARSIRANSVGSTLGAELPTWTVTPVAERVQAEFPCLHSNTFSLSVTGETTRARCQLGGVWMRWAVRVPRSLAPTLFLDETQAIKLKMTGSSVGVHVDSGLVTAAGTTHEVDQQGERIAFRADSPDLALELDVGEDEADRRLELHAPSASAVHMAGQEVLPVTYAREQVEWVAVAGTLFGIWLGALGGLVLRRPWRRDG
jgi:hypothetical protein